MKSEISTVLIIPTYPFLDFLQHSIITEGLLYTHYHGTFILFHKPPDGKEAGFTHSLYHYLGISPLQTSHLSMSKAAEVEVFPKTVVCSRSLLHATRFLLIINDTRGFSVCVYQSCFGAFCWEWSGIVQWKMARLPTMFC